MTWQSLHRTFFYQGILAVQWHTLKEYEPTTVFAILDWIDAIVWLVLDFSYSFIVEIQCI
jgi:hypothetical protein